MKCKRAFRPPNPKKEPAWVNGDAAQLVVVGVMLALWPQGPIASPYVVFDRTTAGQRRAVEYVTMPDPDEIAAALEAFVDVLIPGDADFPSASSVGTHGLVAERIRAAQGSDGLIALAEALNADGPFLDGNRA